jgi:hypothetical protein
MTMERFAPIGAAIEAEFGVQIKMWLIVAD